MKVLRIAGRDKHGRLDWLCLCDCGQRSVVHSENLLTGNTKSCGCLRKQPASSRLDLTGERFGMLTVFKRLPTVPGGISVWRCRCDCGSWVDVKLGGLRSGKIVRCRLHRKVFTSRNESRRRKMHVAGCEICGSKKNLEVHHIDLDSKNNDDSNLIKLCSSCHHKVHWIIKKGGDDKSFLDREVRE